MKNLVYLLVLTLAFVGCSIKENSEKAVENSGLAADNSYKAASTSELLYYASHAGATEISRRDAKRSLKEAKEFDEKARYAASFYKSLSFQSLNKVEATQTLDYNSYRDKVLRDDVKIIRRLAKDLMPSSRKFKVTSLKGDNGSIKALAAAMHQKHPICEEAAAALGHECLSFLDYVHEALYLYYVEGKKPSELKDYQRVIVRRSGLQAFLYMLELRVKFLPMIAIAQVSQLNEGLLPKIKMILGKWRTDYGALDAYTQKSIELTAQEDEIELDVAKTGIKKWKLQDELRVVEADIARIESEQDELSKQLDEGKVTDADYENEINISDSNLEKLEAERNSIENKIAKLEKKIESRTSDHQVASAKNNKKMKKIETKEAKEQRKKIGYVKASEEDLYYFIDVLEKVVEDRDFLRSIEVKKGSGRFTKSAPLRNADLPGIVVRLLKNLQYDDLEELLATAIERERVERESDKPVSITSTYIKNFITWSKDLKKKATYEDLSDDEKVELFEKAKL
jgi:ribosome-associated translation inhibitor RaiA